MEIDISKHIVELLYEHDVVSLPGLGSFVGTYKSAVVDQVSGTVAPPAKTITFDDNLRMDDGLLIDTVSKTYGVTFDTASELVQNYVTQIQEVLGRREIVSFPNLGRLYRDFEQNLQFLPDVTNFNTEAHGLPDVKAYPIASSQPEPEPPVPVAEPVVVENQRNTGPLPSAVSLGRLINHWLRDNVLLVGIAAAIVVAILFFTLVRGPIDDATSSNETPVNVAPPITDENYKNDFPAEEVPQDQRKPLTSDKQGAIVDDGTEEEERSPVPPTTKPVTPPKTTEKPVVTTPAPTTTVASRTGIIAIGTFKDQGNVAKLVEKISAAGLTPYKSVNGDLTKVGVQFSYSTTAELNAMLSTVRKKFEPGAVILQK